MIRIEHLLRRTIGLDAASVGATGIQRAVRLRMRSLGLKRPEDYEQLLQKSRTEWNELVESVVVTETWFFRDAEPIAAFVRLVLEQWLPAHPVAPLRLLSIPCASGEEPYSLAMALLDAGVPPDRFQIEAVDISARSLAQAHRGVYGKNSFRGKDLAFRDRYFQPSKDGFVLATAVRQCVRFSQANLLSDTFLAGHAIYDFIFCRNLLIYFDRPTQGRALTRIQRLLAPSGVLFVGPVEQPVVLAHGFVSANLPTAFAYRKAGHAIRRQRLARPSHRLALSRGPQPAVYSRPKLPPSGRLLPSPTAKPYFLPRADLDAARRLADAGRLKEAAEICESHLRESKASAQAYYLLGLVRDATGDASALDCYRKALYLEPNHYESLLQMALLLQKNGDDGPRARPQEPRATRQNESVTHPREHLRTANSKTRQPSGRRLAGMKLGCKATPLARSCRRSFIAAIVRFIPKPALSCSIVRCCPSTGAPGPSISRGKSCWHRQPRPPFFCSASMPSGSRCPPRRFRR